MDMAKPRQVTQRPIATAARARGMRARELVREMAADKSPAQIAEALGCTPANVRYHLRRLGMKPGGPRWMTED